MWGAAQRPPRGSGNSNNNSNVRDSNHGRRGGAGGKKSKPKRLDALGVRFVMDGHMPFVAEHALGSGALDWDFVVACVLTEASCSICKDQHVVAGRMNAACGHVLCGACELKSYAFEMFSCPVCHVNLYNLRPVIVRPSSNAPSLSFTLVAHRKTNCIVWPVSQLFGEDIDKQMDDGFPWDDEEGSQFCKYVRGDASELAEQELELVRTHLLVIRGDPLEKDDLKFWQLVLEAAERKAASLRGLPKPLRLPSSDSSLGDLREYHFLYQASDGRLEFINAFCMKMLLFESGDDVLRLKREIVAKKIVDLERIEYRSDGKRPKQLSHLTDGTQVTLVEGIFDLSRETVKRFQKDLQIRKKTRQNRQNRERDNETRYEAEVRQRLIDQSRGNRVAPAGLLTAEELAAIHNNQPEIVIDESLVPKSSEPPKFMSYAAVAAPDGNSSSPNLSVNSNANSNTSANGALTFAERVRGGRMVTLQHSPAASPPDLNKNSKPGSSSGGMSFADRVKAGRMDPKR